MNVRRSMRWVAALAVVLMATSMVFAQLPTGTILGVVKDPSGTPVPDASLTARDVDTGQTRTVKSDSDGSYRFTALPVGHYEIKTEHDGFDAVTTNGITLAVAQEAVVNIALQLGAISQSVSVTAQAPTVNTTSSSLASLVDEKQISELPLNGRNYLDLMMLQPGILNDLDKRNSGVQLGTWFSSNGAPVRSNNVLLDGAIMTNLLGANPSSVSGSTLGLDGIKEWRVVTNSFSAEYGMTMGSQMLMASKGGTNQFHGDAFDYLRNDVLDADNFFYVPVAANNFARIPPYKRNNFGGSFGGPIIKDKTFFYGVYEGIRERLGVTTVDNVIPAANHVLTNNPGCGGCTVPAVIQPILAQYPIPNLPNNQYTFPYSQPTTEDYGQIRIDQTVSNADQFFGRYTMDNDAQIVTMPYPQFSKQDLVSRNQYVTLAENHVISTSLLNTGRFSFSRTNIAQNDPPVAIENGFIGPQYSLVAGRPIGTIGVGGLASLGGDSETTIIQQWKQNIFTFGDDVFYTKGKHSFKFGTLINHYQQYFIRGGNQNGNLSFANVSQFLKGLPSSFSASYVEPGSITDRTYHNNTLGFYAQDDWRLLPHLTLNLGLRYEVATTYVEQYGHSSSFRDILADAAPTVGAPFKNPSLHDFSPRIGFAWDVFGDGKTAVRGGSALLYDVESMGAALFIGSNTPPFAHNDSVSVPGTNTAPITLPLTFPANSASTAFGGINYNLQQPYMLQYNLSVERQLPWELALSVAYGGSRGVHLMQTTEGNPVIPTSIVNGSPFWSGVAGTCVAGSVTPGCRLNPAWGAYTEEASAGSSNYNSLQAQLTKRLAKGLEVQVAFTWAKVMDDVQGQSTSENASTPVFPEYPQDIRLDRGPATFDVNRNLHVNAIYQFPDVHRKEGIVGTVLSGWKVNGILTEQSGYPFTPVIQTNVSRSGVNAGGPTAGPGSATSDRPNIVPGRSLYSITHGTSSGCVTSTGTIAAGTPLGTPTLFLDPCAFSLQAAGTLGDAARDSLRGPGLSNLDFSIIKDTSLKIREGALLEFRAEFFNLFNHPNFTTPAVGVGNSAAVIFSGTTTAPLGTAGSLNSTSGINREIQLALKVIF